MLNPTRLLLGALVAPFLLGANLGEVAIGAGDASVSAMSDGTTHKACLGCQSIGDNVAGATPVFDTGNPETETWGLPAEGLVSGMTLLVQYVASDISDDATETWTGTGSLAVTLTSQGDGTTVDDRSSPVPDVSEVATPNDRFQAASAPGVEFGTQDLVVEALVRQTADTGGEIFVGNTSTAVGRNGIEIFNRNIGDGRTYCRFVTSAAATDVYSTGNGTTDEQWHLIVCMFDRDGYMAVSSGSFGTFNVGAAHVAMTESGEDLNNGTDAFTVGGRPTSSSLGYSSDVAWVRVWGCDGCLSVDATPDEYDDELATLFARVNGSYLDTGGAPSTATRASTAYLRKCDPTTDTVTYHLVGDNWPRREVSCGYTWDDPTSSETTVASFLQEAATTNILDFGTALDNAAWTKINSATVDANQQNDPAGNATLDDIDGVTGSGEHGVSQAQTLTAASYTLSAVYKPGNQTFAYMDVSSIANVSAYWDSTDCQPDTVGSAATAYGYDLGDLCYIYLVYTGTAASHTHRLLCAQADGDKDYAGAAGDCSYGWVGVAQTEAPHSPILTVDATDVTRSQDVLEYTTATVSTSAGFTAVSDAWNDTANGVIVNAYSYLVYENGNEALTRSGIYADGNNRWRAVTRHDGQTLTSSSSTPATNRHIARVTAAPSQSVLFYVDGALADTDTELATMPTSWDTHIIGMYPGASVNFDGNIVRARLYEGAIAPGEQGTGDDTP